MAMQKLKRQFEMHFGIEIEVRALSIDRLHQEILDNAGRTYSRYDLVTCDVCWMEEMINAEAIRPVQTLEGVEAQDLMDFHPEALSTAKRGIRYMAFRSRPHRNCSLIAQISLSNPGSSHRNASMMYSIVPVSYTTQHAR